MKYSAILIKNIRKKVNLSQQKFAESLNIPFKLISNIEYDKSTITKELLEKINKKFPELKINIEREYIICLLSKELGRKPAEEEIMDAIEGLKEKNIHLEPPSIENDLNLTQQDWELITDLILSDRELFLMFCKRFKTDRNAVIQFLFSNK